MRGSGSCAEPSIGSNAGILRSELLKARSKIGKE